MGRVRGRESVRGGVRLAGAGEGLRKGGSQML